MFCSNCGTQLPDEANFCWKCGKPQKSSIQVDEPKWETAKIKFEVVKEAGFFSTSSIKFIVEAIGPNGIYDPLESQAFKGDMYNFPAYQSAESTRVHEELVTKLVKDGWESTGEANFWFSNQFRRRVK